MSLATSEARTTRRHVICLPWPVPLALAAALALGLKYRLPKRTAFCFSRPLSEGPSALLDLRPRFLLGGLGLLKEHDVRRVPVLEVAVVTLNRLSRLTVGMVSLSPVPLQPWISAICAPLLVLGHWLPGSPKKGLPRWQLPFSTLEVPHWSAGPPALTYPCLVLPRFASSCVSISSACPTHAASGPSPFVKGPCRLVHILHGVVRRSWS